MAWYGSVTKTAEEMSDAKGLYSASNHNKHVQQQAVIIVVITPNIIRETIYIKSTDDDSSQDKVHNIKNSKLMVLHLIGIGKFVPI